MDYTRDLYYRDIFNYYNFFTSGDLTDCELHVHKCKEDPSFTTIKAHKLILANLSLFFNNAFTAGMEESETGVTEIYQNPHNLIPRVIEWMYTGKIDFSVGELMPLINIAHNFEITKLESKLNSIFEQHINSTTILDFAKKCYDDELPKELQMLVPYIASHFNELPISELSSTLDVFIFAQVIQLTNLSTEEKVTKITEFLQDWNPSEEEKIALSKAFDPEETNELNSLVLKHNITWLP